ncbi:MAG TPA: hypothetical protein VI248_03465 [Kineosporiaceae bacterium]
MADNPDTEPDHGPGDPDAAPVGRGDLDRWAGQARELAAAGEYEEALRLHRRYFVTSRAFPALYGVRLSFALADWAELAAVYPPARRALEQARQEATDRLHAGSEHRHVPENQRDPGQPAEPTPGDSFAEVEAISEALGEPDVALALFADLDARAPETAAECSIVAHRLLVRSGRRDLARKYLGDPLRKVARLADILQLRLERGYAYLPEEKRDARRQEAVREYVAEVRDVLALLTGPDDAELARRTLGHAVEAISWGHVREEVSQGLADHPGQDAG